MIQCRIRKPGKRNVENRQRRCACGDTVFGAKVA